MITSDFRPSYLVLECSVMGKKAEHGKAGHLGKRERTLLCVASFLPGLQTRSLEIPRDQQGDIVFVVQRIQATKQAH